MENQQGSKDIAFKKFTWIIRDFSKNKAKKLRSEAFEIGGCKWRILVNPIKKGVEHLSLYLKVADSLPSHGNTKHAYFKLSLINQMDSEMSITKETQQKFDAIHSSWGVSFLNLNDFCNATKGYLVNNACIIEAQVYISDIAFKIEDTTTNNKTIDPKMHEDSTHLEVQSVDSDGKTASFKSINDDSSSWNQEEDETLSPSQGHYEPSAPPLYPTVDDEPVEVPLTPLMDLIDFKSLNVEELAFVVLLDDVCSRYPSLIESQRKRTPKFIHWAFMSLGQVLYFLETNKVKNMDESACEHLQSLWEEVKLFGFDDLTWLEPHVENALKMKDYLERAEKIRRMKEEVVALENEAKKLRASLAVIEVDLNNEKRHLVEGEKGFEEIDVEAQLCYDIF